MTQILSLVLLAAIICLFVVKRERARWRIFMETSVLVLLITIYFDISSGKVNVEDYARMALIVLLFAMFYFRYQAWVKRSAEKHKTPIAAAVEETQPKTESAVQ